jgi:tRNA U34 5-methylaminomethyl-2-thiouridine-forming methyltransferase MnmC
MDNFGYRIIKTEDGSDSLFSDEYGQAMHSVSGAYEEAVLKHVRPSGILELTERELYVLDIGFGIGYNVLALIYEFLRKRSDQRLNIISLEKDFSCKPLMEKIVFNDERDIIFSNIRNCMSSGETATKQYSIKMIYSDARKSIRSLNNYLFDAVFHDPYSPSKNPELWTVDFFMEVRKIIKENAVLTTYSSAPQIRMALVEAGFKIGIGPSVGKKKEGTLASPGIVNDRMSDALISELKSNYKSTPYTDNELKDERDEILNRRLKLMKKRRSGIL